MPFKDMQSRPPAPPTELGRLRVLSSTAGVRMSPLIFGGISVGTTWGEYTAVHDKDASFELLDGWAKAGGVSIDTANGYSDEQSETWIGDWMEARGNRDQMVICTKFTSDYRSHAIGKNEYANFAGNARKSLHISLHASLKKLKTDYIDILYIHWWDWTTSISELMDGLDSFVKQGKVLYLGASNLPAWVVSACNEYAMARSQARFSVYQGHWNVMNRDLEIDVLPMCRMYGMAVVPFGALGSGRLRNDLSEKNGLDELSIKASETLLRIANAKGLDSFAPIALAWLFQKYPRVFPITGYATEEQLHDNIRALSTTLSREDMTAIDAISPPRQPSPYDTCGLDPHVDGVLGGNNALQLGTIQWI
ncbi:NADP-dependent oxidoreductase domain-containing protein [Kockovaella imperatae]|uniref:NADP-dependent oxidoreductase domain-containing protein n=1 Tax=Kockovaella imperatae TaxID=4999 RepID=A0A1Y1UJT5_9TREE|nr:NADP-dependent oxidoreductase domain-containing protein [Kockovaella imperatae]ORX37797.1 NADP-dependent oxidoreductase domain-containing protein [Kockovaella imperatae]